MKIQLANHYGMCFGVRDALRATHAATTKGPVTILGQLVHNPIVNEHLDTLGVQRGDLEKTDSAKTKEVVITAHGAADRHRSAWKAAGYKVTDTTCPLVHKAHKALALLVAKGYSPVVVGKADHVEVQGLTGDFPQARVVATAEEATRLPFSKKIGVVSQTTQRIDHVKTVVAAIENHHRDAEVRFVDTVCQPTKDRQRALEELCQENEVIVVVGGQNSNNTHQLVNRARKLGAIAYHVERPDDVDPSWFSKAMTVGVTAGTSTLDESVRAVVDRLQLISANQNLKGIFGKLSAAM